MKCPFCGNIDSKVIDSRPSDNNTIKRRRECEKCKAIDDANGSHAGTMITFVNTIAERVKATGKYDNVIKA